MNDGHVSPIIGLVNLFNSINNMGNPEINHAIIKKNNKETYMSIIDTTFDVRTDTPVGKDPDSKSPTLRKYHQLLWSKELPCGQKLELNDRLMGYIGDTEYWFSGDSITHSFSRWSKYQHIIKQIDPNVIADFKSTGYTIGGNIIFPANVPKGKMSINQRRGMLVKICDRFDLTLECIRRYYLGLESPLFSCISDFKPFFDAFVDFKGYVEFFLLQDLVTNDYSAIKYWYPFPGEFYSNPLPQSPEEYLMYVDTVLKFLDDRNKRIDSWAKANL